jgi:hypothetical protein
MAIAPFIRPILEQGGSFYTFSSAAEDLSLTFNNSGKKFTFSKYALLDIPDIKRPEFPSPNEENVVQLDTMPGAFQYINNTKTNNVMFAESLQNYVLNLETMVTSFPSYDATSLHTVSERVFFKWIKEIGGIRFREASLQEAPLSAGLRYTEENASAVYTPVVRYVGDIDIVNSLKSTEDAYSEIYINVPTKDGATPVILFKSEEDINYYSSMNLIHSPQDPLNRAFIYGRNYDQINPAGLDTHAFFDSIYQDYGIGTYPGATVGDLPTLTTEGEYQLLKYNESTSEYEVGWWFPYPETYSYWTQPGASASGTYDDWKNDSFQIIGVKDGAGTSNSITFRRSRLDGIGIDFNINNYTPIATNPSLRSFSDFNSIPEAGSFRFNAVLVYYDVEDISTGNSATNLFGVLFLDDVKDTLTGGSYIPRLQKFKPNRITGLNGNAYGFKINLKFDTNSDQAAVVSAVNEYAPFSLHVFLDALNRMQVISNKMLDNQNKILSLQLQINELRDSLTGGTTIQDINDRLDNIDQQLTDAGLMFENSSDLLDLLNRNYTEIRNIYANKTSVKMSYDLDILKQGAGILLDKSVPNQITVNNGNQQYNFVGSPLVNVLTSFSPFPLYWKKIMKLNPFTNYIKLSNGIANTFDRDVNIYVDDELQRWQNGQVMRIVVDMDYPMDMYTQGSFDLAVYTDAVDRLSTGSTYSKEIARVDANAFYAANGAPRVEIVCIDAANYIFTYDLI